MEYIWQFLESAWILFWVLVAIGFCIVSHEAGHFFAARMRGLHVDAFALGFKPFWRKKINGVEYRLGYLPFGGYVELPQIDASDEIPKSADGAELPRATAMDRIITAAAGPLTNILCGFILGCYVWYAGIPQMSPKMREITVQSIAKDSPEFNAGLRPGDRIVKINGKEFYLSWQNFITEMLFNTGSVDLGVIDPDGNSKTVSYVPAVNPYAPDGIKLENLAYPFFTPLIVTKLAPQKDSPAERAGILEGDTLVAFNDQVVFDFAEFQKDVNFNGGETATITVLRDGKELKFDITPEPLPDLTDAEREEFSSLYLGLMMELPGENETGATVSRLFDKYPAQAAGILPGDVILRADGKDLTSDYTLNMAVEAKKGEAVALDIRRGAEELKLQIAPKRVYPFTIGVELAFYDHPSPWQQFKDTLRSTWKAVEGIGVWTGHKLGMTEKTSTIKPSNLSGPLHLGTVLFTTIKSSSLSYTIYFLVMISFALAIFNLLPMPVLDGGHIFFGLYELILRRPVPAPVLKALTTVFFTLLVTLMIFVTFFDGKRLLHSLGMDISSGTTAADSDNPKEAANDSDPATNQP